MNNCYLISHIRVSERDENKEDEKLIGFYSSLEKAQATIEKYKSIMGFKEYPDGFRCRKFPIKGVQEQGRQSAYIYILRYIRSSGKYPDDEIVKNLGVYINTEFALRDLKTFKKSPEYQGKPYGFHEDYPEGLYVEKYRLDEGSWKEGFSVVGIWVKILDAERKFPYVKALSNYLGHDKYEIFHFKERIGNSQFDIGDVVHGEQKIIQNERFLAAVKKIEE